MTQAQLPLGEFCQIVQGGRHKLSGNNFVEQGYPAYGAGGMNGQLPSFEFDEEAVILSSIGARCGKCFYAQGKWSSLANTQVIRPNPLMADCKFLWYQLNDESRWHRSGTGQPFIKPSDVKTHLVYLPPLPEQRRIATILEKADALQATRLEALEQLDRLAHSVFIEMFGAYDWGETRWPKLPLGDLATDMRIGLVRSSEEFGDEFAVPYVRMNAIGRRGEFFPDLVQRTDVVQGELEEYRLRKGDILFNTRNSKELVGKTAIFHEDGDHVYNNNLMRLRLDSRVEPEYLAKCFLTPLLQQELEFRKSGTTSVFAIYGRDLVSIPIPVPPLELQRQFAMRMRAQRSASLAMAAQQHETTQLFASLKRRAFQGVL